MLLSAATKASRRDRMIYLLQLFLGIVLVGFGLLQDSWIYGVASVVLGIALFVPFSWWQRKGGA